MKHALMPLGLLSLCVCCSCAAFVPENRRLVTWVEKHMVPEGKTERVLVAPVVLPVGMVAGVLDVFVVHPIYVMDDAYQETMDELWRGWDLKYVTYCGSLPFRILGTPVLFVGDFLARSMFDIEANEGPPRAQKPPDDTTTGRSLSTDAFARAGDADRQGKLSAAPVEFAQQGKRH